MKYICLITCLVYTLQCASQTIVNPVFDRTDHYEFHVDKIETYVDSTILYCSLSMEANSWANISPNTYIEDVLSGKKYSIIRSEGIPFSPDIRNFSTHTLCKIRLVFPTIKKTTKINLIENPDKEAFNVYGISLTKYFEKTYSYSEMDLLSIRSSFYETAGDTIKAIQYKKENNDATGYIYGVMSEEYFVSLQALSAMLNEYAHFEETIRYMTSYYSAAKEFNVLSIQIPISAVYIGFAYYNCKNEKLAIKWFEDAYKQFQQYSRRQEYHVYCELVNYLTHIYNLQGKFSKAFAYAKEACEIAQSHFGTKSAEYIEALALLSDSEFGMNQQEKGLEHLEGAIAIIDSIPSLSLEYRQQYRYKLYLTYKRLNINKDVENNILKVTDNAKISDAINDYNSGNVEGCTYKLYELLEKYKSHFQTTEMSYYVTVVQLLANALTHAGNYSEADAILNDALEFLKDYDIDSRHIRPLYEAKGMLYNTISNLDMALYWYNQAKDKYAVEDQRSLQYGILLSNIAVCQMAKDNYSLAKQLSEKAYEICVRFYGDNGNSANDRLLILNNLATIYTKLKEFTKGKELYERIIEEAASQQNIGTKALALINLSEIYLLCENNFSKAEEYLRKAMKLEAASYIRDMAEMDLAFAQIMQKNTDAVNSIDSYNTRIKEGLISMFGHFSETEREKYWTQKSQSLVFLNNLAAMTFNTPQSFKMAYDNTIYTKSVLINSGRLLRQLVNDCNLDVQNEYSLMINMKRKLSDKNFTRDSIGVYREAISQKEKAIVAAIPNFGSKLMAQFKTCSDVQMMLSDNEIAIEFIFLPQIKFPFDESEWLYGAMLLTKCDTTPKLITLCSEHDLKNLMDAYSPMGQNEIDSLYAFSNKTLYHMIWEKIEPYIPIGSTVYYSPTGYISKINLSAVSNGNNRMAELYDFHEVSTTALIDELKQCAGMDYLNAALYGDINYSEDVDLMAERAKGYSLYTSGEVLATRSLNGGTWDLLPGTKEEVETIAEMLRGKNTNVYMFTQNDANEESFKAFDANAPALIHIATHGFYFPPEEDVTSNFFNGLHSYTQKDYSMLYSGLLFAGGNNAWIGIEIEGSVEDGILTADEISRLDLSTNKLIVLSACNTGLGDIDNVDGVFGLQRGLKRAGAKTVLMSLWKVPDEETNDLMRLFYKELLNGNTPQQSLMSAQKQMIAGGKTPYYWAGFILLD